MEKKYFVFLLFGVLLIGGFILLRGGESPAGNVVASGGPGEIVEVTTTLQGFQYNPDTITIKEGSKVRLTVNNKDSVLHAFNLKQFGIIGSIQPRSTKTVEFTAIKTNGQAVYTCSQEHGETLTIKVV